MRLQFAQAQQNWTVEDWKNVVWSDESRFLLRYSDVRVRIWRKQNENMDPSCLVTTVQAGGGGGSVMVWGMLSYQYGPTFLNNASSTLLNQCHKELRQL
uniref:Transposable element Tc1 transposase n=1 Tax=Sander lucioperca TaxID=283035 RepID=A0A8C9XZM5_SANLU